MNRKITYPFTLCIFLILGYMGCNPSSSEDTSSNPASDSTSLSQDSTQTPNNEDSEETNNNDSDNLDSNNSDNSDNSSENSNDTIQTNLTNIILTRTSASCEDYIESYTATARDINRNTSFQSSIRISVMGEKCVISSNAIPNHDFNDGNKNFVTSVTEQTQVYEIPKEATAANNTTALTLQYDNAVFLNGVKLDLLAAGCFGVGDGKIGCNDMSAPWRYDPVSESANFGTDSHNAHTQPTGAYHYHASPKALFSTTDSSKISPVIGFAADGFPIFGTYFNDNGTIRKARSSYQLKSGDRVAVNGLDPEGNYDGTFREDYEYIEGTGDLDECNGMTQNGTYGYYITESYPWVLGCFTGTPDPSFSKR